MSIYKQLDAKEKAINIINSCKTILHINAASNYIELYYKKFDDYIGYHELLHTLKIKENEQFTKNTR